MPALFQRLDERRGSSRRSPGIRPASIWTMQLSMRSAGQGGHHVLDHFDGRRPLPDRGSAREGTTRSIRAGTPGRSGRSVRSKTMPVPARPAGNEA